MASMEHARAIRSQCLNLGEGLLDRIEVRRVGRQERELGAGGEDRIAYRARSMGLVQVGDCPRV
jgi:hypothetical protein